MPFKGDFDYYTRGIKESPLAKHEGGRVTYEGYPIIGKDKPINGGVFASVVEPDAVVVDDKHDPELLRVFAELMRRRKAAESRGIEFKNGIFEEVFNLVKETIPNNSSRYIKHTEGWDQPPQLVYLSEFFGGAVCKHQALLCGYLLEKLIKDGRLRGSVSVDSNLLPLYGGHSWVRYINSEGGIFIIDVMLNSLLKLGPEKSGDEKWDYRRPTDPGAGGGRASATGGFGGRRINRSIRNSFVL